MIIHNLFGTAAVSGTATEMLLPLIKSGTDDDLGSGDWTPAAGDVKLIQDGGSPVNINTLPVYVAVGAGFLWRFVFTAGEMSYAKIVVKVYKSGVVNTTYWILTNGNASAYFKGNLFNASGAANITQIAGTDIPTPATAGILDVNVTRLLNSPVSTPATAGIMDVNVKNWRNETIPATSSTGVPKVEADVTKWLGTAATTPTVAGTPKVEVVGTVGANVTQWRGTNVAVPSVAGIPTVDAGTVTLPAAIAVNVTKWNNHAVSDTTPGTPDVNATGVTLSGTVDANVVNWKGTAVPTPAVAGVPDVNSIKLNNRSITGSGSVAVPSSIASPSDVSGGGGGGTGSGGVRVSP